MRFKLLFVFVVISTWTMQAQESSQTGAWYMYFFNNQFKNSQFGIQGDLQYRNWNTLGDLEQLLIRTGLTYTPKDVNALFTFGVANITTGEFGDSNETTGETRLYQEALIPQKLGKRVYLSHRFRYEQRFVENQDFRTRYRYNLFMNIPFNKEALTKDAIYAAFYNELFINGQTDIGDNRASEAEASKASIETSIKSVLTAEEQARVPVEDVFDLGIGDIFVARVAGNIENRDIVGSMEFASAVAGSKVVIVMGHTACGAVKHAIDNTDAASLEMNA